MKFLISLVLGAALCAPVMAVQSATGTASKKAAHSKTKTAHTKMANKGQAVSTAMHQKNAAKKVAKTKGPMRDAKGRFVSSKGASSIPAGATAMCKDGTYSTSKTAAGTCSGHGGVKVWLKRKK